MDREQVFGYTKNCYSGEPASCTFACPFHLDLRSFLKKAAKGRWDAAYKELRSSVLFPSVTASLCPRPCETVCQRHTVVGDTPVAVGLLEQACIQYAGKKEAVSYPIPAKTESVAVVGAGVSGLSCALILAQRRFNVTVFDKNSAWGGFLRTHKDFPEFDKDFSSAFGAVDVTFEFNREISGLEELDSFEAVLLATGKNGIDFGLMKSFNALLCATENPRIFLTGELTGSALIEGMAQGTRAARAIEAFIQSGSPDFALETSVSGKDTRYAPHPEEPNVPGIIPAGEFYTPDEAKNEAARCMLCDCTACMDTCELLVTFKKKPPRIGNDVFMDGQSRNSVSTASIPRQAWSCNLCGNCGNKCAEGVDLRGLLRLSRSDRVKNGGYPPAYHDYRLREMEFSVGEGSFFAPGTEYVFFPGCRLGAVNPFYVTKTLDFLGKETGILLNCCGAPAYWAGEDDLFLPHLSALKEILNTLKNPTLITACVTCERMFTEFLPEIKFVSLYEILSEGKIKGNAVFKQAAIFDPCAAFKRNSVKSDVRRLADLCGISVTDYDSGGKCCGFGGHMQLANPELYDKITQNRISETDAPYIVYCVNCREVFASANKDCAHILDAVFNLEPDMVPTLEEKKQNSLLLKKELTKKYMNTEYIPPENPWDTLSVTVMPEAQAKMERLLITLSDLRETIYRAGKTGFVNENGEILCSLTGKALTYWVLFKEETDENGKPLFTITDAYSHRMRAR